MILKNDKQPLDRSSKRLGPAAIIKGSAVGASVHLTTGDRIPIPGTGAAVWVADGNHPLSPLDALTWVDQCFGNVTKKIFSVQDIVDACDLEAGTNSRTIDFLAIFGHGEAGFQGCGCGKHWEDTGAHSLCYNADGESHLSGSAGKILADLNDGVLSDSAQILLAGCNVGTGSEGDGLLTAVSAVLNGRAVLGFENSQIWWTGVLVGTLKVAQGTNITSSFSYLRI
jgi:hypothetical protein